MTDTPDVPAGGCAHIKEFIQTVIGEALNVAIRSRGGGGGQVYSLTTEGVTGPIGDCTLLSVGPEIAKSSFRLWPAVRHLSECIE